MTNRYEEASEAAKQLLCDFDAIDIAEEAAAANAALDGAYRERARLVAHLASLYPSHIGHTDPTAPDWAVVIVETPAGQMSWHIAQRDLDLFAHVTPTGPASQGWDGHTTDEKYERLRTLTAGLTYPCACGDQWPSPLMGCGHTAWKCWPDADQPTETPS